MRDGLIRRRIRVHGRVQGVWFRESARRHAIALDVAGWIRNVPDGSVEAMAEGQRASVEAFVAWCGEGPAGARVDAVVARAEPPTGLTGFVVKG